MRTATICAVLLAFGILWCRPNAVESVPVEAHVKAHDKALVVPIAPPLCSCPNCGCGKDCRCDGTGCKCEACVSAYAKARSKAERDRLPMLCIVGMANCAPCRALEKTLAEVDTSGFVVVHLDRERDAAVVNALEITRFPAMVVSGPGPMLEWKSTRIGAVDAATIRGEMAKAKATPVTVRAPIGHTHTHCGVTWDHASRPGHDCPVCGTLVFRQDPTPRPVNAAPRPVRVAMSGCASGG